MKLNYNKAEFCAAYGTFSQLPPPERIEIAFAGHSNVGKSTLINKLMNRKSLARVSSVPGKTATINFFGVDYPAPVIINEIIVRYFLDQTVQDI